MTCILKCLGGGVLRNAFRRDGLRDGWKDVWWAHTQWSKYNKMKLGGGCSLCNSFNFSVCLRFFITKCQAGRGVDSGQLWDSRSSVPVRTQVLSILCSINPSKLAFTLKLVRLVVLRCLLRCGRHIAFWGTGSEDWICCLLPCSAGKAKLFQETPSGFLLPHLCSELCSMANRTCRRGGKVINLLGTLPTLPSHLWFISKEGGTDTEETY